MSENDDFPAPLTIGDLPQHRRKRTCLGESGPSETRKAEIAKRKARRKLQRAAGIASRDKHKAPSIIRRVEEENGALVEKIYKKRAGRPRKTDVLAGYALISTQEVTPEIPQNIAENTVETPVSAPENVGPKVIWKPGSAVVEEFLSSSEDEVLMSGGRGSGKSAALLVDPLRYCGNPNFRGLILRRTMPELRELISRAQELYPQVYPGVKYQKSTHIFVFPSGARMEFGYCDRLPDDLEQYKGQEYQWLGLDELTQWSSEEIIEKMRGSLRTTDPSLPISVRCSSNPDGVGRLWVKERYIDTAPAGKTAVFAYDTPVGRQYVTRKWLHSTVYDNPFILENNPSYVGWLHSLKGRLREVWLDGSWDAADGMAYDDFDRRIHVVKPFEIPQTWPRFCAVDWGYGASSLAVCLWFAVDHEGHIYVYREFVANGNVPVEEKLTSTQFARRIVEIERKEKDWTNYTVIDGGTNQDHGASGHGGSAAPTIFEQMRKATPNRRWKLAKKGKGSRAAGKQIIHDLLAIDPHLNKPKLQFFDTCVQVIKELSSLPLDPNNPEDSDPKCPDDAVDCLRYGLTSRPTQGLIWDPFQPRQIRKYHPPINYN